MVEKKKLKIREKSGVYYNEEQNQLEFWFVLHLLRGKHTYHYEELIESLPYIKVTKQTKGVHDWAVGLARELLVNIESKLAEIYKQL